MSNLSNYPAGAQFDDCAPWNLDEEEQMYCDCGNPTEIGEMCLDCRAEIIAQEDLDDDF